MSRPRVHLTSRIPAEVEQALLRDFELVAAPEGADGALSVLTTRVDGPYLDRAGPQLLSSRTTRSGSTTSTSTLPPNGGSWSRTRRTSSPAPRPSWRSG